MWSGSGVRDRRLVLEQGQKLELGRASDVFGAGALNHIGVSTHHLDLRARPGGLRVRDAGSKNGFWVNGRPSKQTMLVRGDVLSLPGAHFVVTPPTAPAKPHALGPLQSWDPWLDGLEGRLREWSSGEEPILLLGETGTGKSQLAEAIHRLRNQGQLARVPLNALSEGTWQRELFGHSRGAYTGAESSGDGACQVAGRGTLFLEEIGRAPRYVQNGLLTLLDGKRQYTRLGDPRPLYLRALVVAASDKPLDDPEKFERALFWRLDGRTVRIPPVRERPEDVLLLARLFGLDDRSFDHDTVGRLLVSDWSGNAREIRSVAEKCQGAADPTRLVCELLAEVEEAPPIQTRAKNPGLERLRDLCRRFGSQAAVARHLGVSPATVSRWMSDDA